MLPQMPQFVFFLKKKRRTSILLKLKVQESYTLRVIEKPRNGREREDQ